jgi:uncharacterized protein (TIGR03118 family)
MRATSSRLVPDIPRKDTLMKTPRFTARGATQAVVLACALAFGPPLLAAKGDPGNSGDYSVTNLVSDVPGAAANQDSSLVNGWGVVAGPTTPMWVSDNGSGKSTVYDGTGALRLTVAIPGVMGTGQGKPTGIVFNLGASPTSNDFLVAGAGTAARFIWSTEDGGIAAWAGGPSATIRFATSDGAVYKGLAMAGDGSAHFRIYAADFHNGKIDVIDSNFAKTSVAGGFVDPNLPATFHPFNIMNIQGNLYVAYALCCEAGSDDEVAGAGLGFVDVFDANGNLIKRVASRGKLNAPWGMALAPAGFGRFSNHLLVGNFGDGAINAYDPDDFHFAGQLRGTNHKPLVIDGLWGMAFGNGFQQQPATTLFFAAGPNDEANGLYGKIEALPGGNDHSDDDSQD